jgi:hypothetical protein
MELLGSARSNLPGITVRAQVCKKCRASEEHTIIPPPAGAGRPEKGQYGEVWFEKNGLHRLRVLCRDGDCLSCTDLHNAGEFRPGEASQPQVAPVMRDATTEFPAGKKTDQLREHGAALMHEPLSDLRAFKSRQARNGLNLLRSYYLQTTPCKLTGQQ